MEHPKPKERFTEVKMIDRSQIVTRPDLFQGRADKFARETVNKIVSEGFDKSQEPIVVWWDEDSKKYIVISGHSRWEASRILFEKGDKSLQKMPAKVFIGDKDDAVDYAVLESNRSGTQEGFISDFKAYKRAVSKGYNREQLKNLFKPESYLSFLQTISFLNEKGKFIEYLSQESEQSFPYLKRNAQWVGVIRKQVPELADAHENEIFDYLYSTDSKKLNLTKDKFIELLERKIGSTDFDPDKPLNLKNFVSPNAYSDPIKEQIKEVENEIKEIERQRSYYENLIVRAKHEKKEDLIPKFKEKIEQFNQGILLKLEEKKKLESSVAKVEKEITTDLFTEVEEKQTKPAPKMKTKGKLSISDIPAIVKTFMPQQQQLAIVGSDEHWNTLAAIEKQINDCPSLYIQDGKGIEAIVYLHYFSPSSDWYITEWERESKQLFGYTILNGDYENAELGYIDLNEILSIRTINLDFYWHEKTLRDALIAKSKYFADKYKKIESKNEKQKNALQENTDDLEKTIEKALKVFEKNIENLKKHELAIVKIKEGEYNFFFPLKGEYKEGDIQKETSFEIVKIFTGRNEYARIEPIGSNSFMVIDSANQVRFRTTSEVKAKNFLDKLLKQATPEEKQIPKKTADSPKDSPKNAAQVSKITPEIRFIQRFVSLHGKTKTQEQILSFINGLQRAIIEKTIRKTSPYVKEMEYIQEKLISIYDQMGASVQITIDTERLQTLKDFADSEKQMLSVTFIKQFISLHGKTGIEKKAVSLLRRINAAIESGKIPESDSNFKELKDVIIHLTEVTTGKATRISVEPAELEGLGMICGIKIKPKTKKSESLGFLPSFAANIAANALFDKFKKKPETPAQPKPTPDTTEKNGEVVSAADVAKKEFHPIGFKGKYRELLGDPDDGFWMMVSGPPKQGKSTFCIDFANYLADNHGPTLFASYEEGTGYTLQDKIKRLKATSPNLFFADKLPGNLGKYRFVFIDSITRAKMTSDDMMKLKADYPNISFIVIFQVTKEGIFRGGQGIEHDVDIVAEVKNGIASANGRYAQGKKLIIDFKN